MDEFGEFDFEETYIDRSVIFLKRRQPFFDWCRKLYPDDDLSDDEELKMGTAYLIDEKATEAEFEKWVSKKFDKIFMFELEAIHTNKKDWPQKRNYKMFKEWFDIIFIPDAFDLEKRPVNKI